MAIVDVLQFQLAILLTRIFEALREILTRPGL